MVSWTTLDPPLPPTLLIYSFFHFWFSSARLPGFTGSIIELQSEREGLLFFFIGLTLASSFAQRKNIAVETVDSFAQYWFNKDGILCPFAATELKRIAAAAAEEGRGGIEIEMRVKREKIQVWRNSRCCEFVVGGHCAVFRLHFILYVL